MLARCALLAFELGAPLLVALFLFLPARARARAPSACRSFEPVDGVEPRAGDAAGAQCRHVADGDAALRAAAADRCGCRPAIRGSAIARRSLRAGRRRPWRGARRAATGPGGSGARRAVRPRTRRSASRRTRAGCACCHLQIVGVAVARAAASTAVTIACSRSRCWRVRAAARLPARSAAAAQRHTVTINAASQQSLIASACLSASASGTLRSDSLSSNPMHRNYIRLLVSCPLSRPSFCQRSSFPSSAFAQTPPVPTIHRRQARRRRPKARSSTAA